MAVYFMFDVESIGLYGEGFAVGYVVASVGEGPTKVLEENLFACSPRTAGGNLNDRNWVKDNIEAIPATHETPFRVRKAFWEAMNAWQQKGALICTDCGYPVESNFLAACVNDNPQARSSTGPYPLYDLSSILLAAGMDPLATTPRLPNELPVHNPLCDSRQSLRQLVEALASIQSTSKKTT